jgi:hypothetical protein
VTHRLQPLKDQFPATIGIQLDTPSPEVDPHRGATNVPNSLSFIASSIPKSNLQEPTSGAGGSRGYPARLPYAQSVGAGIDVGQRHFPGLVTRRGVLF